ncbi:hypothetical protein Tsubulata_023385 [Turnera subulata]|uniref:Pentacotripeptide-repeat region of PRORP domain-containing protein n=1 Tax=Turnera subulata TaxID=218843 RepID=A0A9Q0F877_9ROSI|nr:hypothetical protein Tsubulata_023385 [Turnera subulata]
MVGFLRRIIPYSLFPQLKKKSISYPLPLPRFLRSTVTIPEHSNPIVRAICDSLREGKNNNWETLSRKFHSLELDNSLVDQVLLQLKEPANAKQALAFFHWAAKRKNLLHGVRSYCLMVHVLVRARLLIDARVLVESVLKRNAGEGSSKFEVVDALISSYEVAMSSPSVFDLLVQCYAKLRMFEVGFDVCCYIGEHGFPLSIISFNTLIHVVSKSDDKVSLVWKIYEHMLRRRVYPNEATVKNMISALCKEGKLQEVVDLLDRIHGKRCPPLVMVNTYLMFLVLEQGRIEVGLSFLKGMLQKNMIPDTVAYSLIVHAKVKIGDLDSAVQVYEEMLKRSFDANSFVHTSLIGGNCKLGRVEIAKQLLGEMQDMGLKPYSETFDCLIEGCVKAGKVEESLTYCEKMIGKGLLPSLSAFNQMVGSLCELEDVNQANVMLTRLLDKGFVPNEVTYSLFISAYEKKGQIQEVLKLYYEMEYHRLLPPGPMVFTSLIRVLCKYGRVGEAEKYLRIMKERSLDPTEDVYEALISSNVEKGNTSRANHHYNEMVSKGMKPRGCYTFGVDKESMKILDSVGADI